MLAKRRALDFSPLTQRQLTHDTVRLAWSCDILLPSPKRIAYSTDEQLPPVRVSSKRTFVRSSSCARKRGVVPRCGCAA
jgi:hypothetical protein